MAGLSGAGTCSEVDFSREIRLFPKSCLSDLPLSQFGDYYNAYCAHTWRRDSWGVLVRIRSLFRYNAGPHRHGTPHGHLDYFNPSWSEGQTSRDEPERI